MLCFRIIVVALCSYEASIIDFKRKKIDKGIDMSTLATILNTLVVILAVLLIALILVQPSKSGGGFGSAFGGLGESVFGAQAMSHLSKLTVWCMSIFFVLTLASAIVAGHMRTADTSVVEEESSIALEITDDTAHQQHMEGIERYNRNLNEELKVKTELIRQLRKGQG